MGIVLRNAETEKTGTGDFFIFNKRGLRPFVNQELLDHLDSLSLNNSISPDYRKENSRLAHLKSFRYLRHNYLFTNGRPLVFFFFPLALDDFSAAWV